MMAEKAILRERDSAHAGNGADAFEHVFVKLPDGRAYFVAIFDGSQAEDHQVIAVVAELNVPEFLEAVDEEAGNHQQNERQRNLCNDQNLAYREAATCSTNDAAGVRFQNGIQVHAG